MRPTAHLPEKAYQAYLTLKQHVRGRRSPPNVDGLVEADELGLVLEGVRPVLVHEGGRAEVRKHSGTHRCASNGGCEPDRAAFVRGLPSATCKPWPNLHSPVTSKVVMPHLVLKGLYSCSVHAVGRTVSGAQRGENARRCGKLGRWPAASLVLPLALLQGCRNAAYVNGRLFFFVAVAFT